MTQHRTRGYRGAGHQRFPVQPLLDRLCASDMSSAAVALGVSRRMVYRAREDGLTEAAADRWSIAAGFHPSEVWNDWFTPFTYNDEMTTTAQLPIDLTGLNDGEIRSVQRTAAILRRLRGAEQLQPDELRHLALVERLIDGRLSETDAAELVA